MISGSSSVSKFPMVTFSGDFLVSIHFFMDWKIWSPSVFSKNLSGWGMMAMMVPSELVMAAVADSAPLGVTGKCSSMFPS